MHSVSPLRSQNALSNKAIPMRHIACSCTSVLASHFAKGANERGRHDIAHRHGRRLRSGPHRARTLVRAEPRRLVRAHGGTSAQARFVDAEHALTRTLSVFSASNPSSQRKLASATPKTRARNENSPLRRQRPELQQKLAFGTPKTRVTAKTRLWDVKKGPCNPILTLYGPQRASEAAATSATAASPTDASPTM